DVGVEHVLLKRAQSASDGCDLLDRVGDHLLRLHGVSTDQRVVPAAAQARKEAIDRVAQLGGGDGADADVDLSLAVDFRTDLELGSAAGDGEAGPGRVDRRAER